MALPEYARKVLGVRIAHLALPLLSIILAPLAGAAAIATVGHVTDGVFTSPTEWTGPNANTKFFAPAAGGSGNAWLYAEQVNGVLYLMYDYVGNTATQPPSSFFDVFFQVANDDYGIHIRQSGFTAFEKPVSILSPLNPDGSFNFNAPPWTPVTAADLALANFQAAMGLGMSPNLSTPHWMAEFQLTINNTKSGPPNGLYSPAPAFWSASVGGGGGAAAASSPISLSDPPITSAIFTLNPDSTIMVTPDLRNGAPIMEDSVSSTPEPATLWMFVCSALVLLAFRWRRQSPSMRETV